MPLISRNPATGAILWEGRKTPHEQIDAIVQQAAEAFPQWSQQPLEERIAILHRFADILKKAPLPELISQETGKPLWESKTEVQAMIGKVAISIDAYHERCPEKTQSVNGATLVTRHKPHGVVAVLGPFNFPGHLPNGHIVPALLAGNTVVFKPSTHTPAVGELLYDCWQQAGLPPGVLSLIQGDGETLVTHPLIAGIFMTGSYATGEHLHALCGPEKILALEMGGNAPLVIDEINDLEAAAYLTIQSAYITAGQRCTCARRLIVVDNPAFVLVLKEMIGRIHVGPYTDIPEPFMGPVINEETATKLMAVQERLGTPLIPMRQNGAFLTPGLIEVTSSPDEEYFGPLLQLIHVPTFEAALIEACKTSYGLAAGLFSTNREHYARFLSHVPAGVINWNRPTTGASGSAPFGGIGRSGNHRPSAYYAADYCAYPVASMETETLSLPKTPLPGLSLEKKL